MPQEEAGRNEASPKGNRQMLVAAAVAMVSFVAVLLHLTYVARSSAPTNSSRVDDVAVKSRMNNPQLIRIEWLTQRYRKNAAGVAELEVKGLLRNFGGSPVTGADLKCRFKTTSGEETFLEIPVIIATQLDDLDGGRLNAYSSREFGARIGDFPEGLQPEILDWELVNVVFPKF